MFVAGNLIATLAHLLDLAFNVYWWMIIIRVMVSWVSPDPFNPVVQFLHRATDPVLEPFRRVIPTIGMFDISPIVVLVLLRALQHFAVQSLMDFSWRLR